MGFAQAHGWGFNCGHGCGFAHGWGFAWAVPSGSKINPVVTLPTGLTIQSEIDYPRVLLNSPKNVSVLSSAGCAQALGSTVRNTYIHPYIQHKEVSMGGGGDLLIIPSHAHKHIITSIWGYGSMAPHLCDITTQSDCEGDTTKQKNHGTQQGITHYLARHAWGFSEVCITFQCLKICKLEPLMLICICIWRAWPSHRVRGVVAQMRLNGRHLEPLDSGQPFCSSRLSSWRIFGTECIYDGTVDPRLSEHFCPLRCSDKWNVQISEAIHFQWQT